MIKPEFDGREHTWHLKEPFECVDLKPLRAGAAWPTIPLNAVDVGGVFDPSVNKIRAMVDDQVAEVRIKKGEDPKVRASAVVNRVRALISPLLSVSSSSWLEDLVDLSICSRRSRSTSTTALKFYSPVGLDRMANSPSTLARNVETLLTLCNSWTAICRGAVIHATTITGISAFSVQVQARIARVSCGIAVREEWSSNKHAKKDKAWSESRQAWRAKDQMKWLLKVVCPSPQIPLVRADG